MSVVYVACVANCTSVKVAVPVRLVAAAGCPLAREGCAGNTQDRGHGNPCASAAYVRMLTNVQINLPPTNRTEHRPSSNHVFPRLVNKSHTFY